MKTKYYSKNDTPELKKIYESTTVKRAFGDDDDEQTTNKIIMKYNKTILKSIIFYVLRPFPKGLSGVDFGTLPKASASETVLILGSTNFAKILHS